MGELNRDGVFLEHSKMNSGLKQIEKSKQYIRVLLCQSFVCSAVNDQSLRECSVDNGFNTSMSV